MPDFESGKKCKLNFSHSARGIPSGFNRCILPPTTLLRNVCGNIIRGRTRYYKSKNSFRRITMRHRGLTMLLLMLSWYRQNVLRQPAKILYTLKDIVLSYIIIRVKVMDCLELNGSISSSFFLAKSCKQNQKITGHVTPDPVPVTSCSNREYWR